MKKILLFLLCFVFAVKGFSQNSELNKSAAWALVQKSSDALGFSPAEMSNLSVAQSFTNPAIGASYIYLQQTWKNIPVHNRIIVLAYKNDRLLSKAGELFPSPGAYSNDQPATPATTAFNALQAAAWNVKAQSPLSGAGIPDEAGRLNFGKMGIAYEDITAQLYWLPVKTGGKTTLNLVWQIFLAPVNTDDMWQIRVDAKTNTVLEKNNLTVYDQMGKPHADESKASPFINNFSSPAQPAAAGANSPSLVGTVNYLVVPYPVESPLYGPATTVTNPWTMTGAFNANTTTLKWHNDGATNYTISRGNNVWATEDRAGTNNGGTVTPTGLPATSSTTPDPLNFNFTPDYTVAPTNLVFQQYAITNLFYWNNIMHDLSYQYGFDEVSGNFQNSNLGRGGTGNDYVIAIAQSAAGTNNANFATPADGGRGRMRMYLFTAPNPDRDGDLDAGVMCHEYTHGISNRLTGGIAGAGGCLSNAEEGGEGWSDYFGLMATTNWATAQITDGFNIKRPIGNYVLAQPTTGAGIRTKPYCTNFAINNLTYAFVASSGGEVHDIGEVWCATLWDMTWNIIQMDGINPNQFNAAGVGGNSVAMNLVIEGMKLQPCSPGFIDARDAILQADQLLYAGRYHCAILTAFARRGMGTDARQGSSGSTSDQTVGFSTIESNLTLTQSVTQQQEGLQVTYTNHVTSGACGAIVNYLITDTLPANVTYVSGGTYNAGNRVVSFTVNVPAGTTVDYPFTVQINAGSYFPTVTVFEDAVTTPTIATSPWTASTTAASSWTISTARSHSPTSAYFCAGVPTISDARLFSTTAIALPAAPPNLSFWHWFSTESTYDGGILEISTDGGTTYTYVPAASFLSNGYNTAMDATTVLAGKTAWSGNSGGFIKTVVDLTPYANQSIKLRFRNTNDNGTNLEGWYIDDIAIKKQATVDIRSSLFNSTGVRLQTADTFTIILPSAACTPIAITTPPSNVVSCSGSTVTFAVAVTGSSPSYQWQLSTDGGTIYNNIAGQTGATLVLTNITVAMSGYKYRVIVSNACPSSATSAAATLTVNPGVSITGQPASVTTCAGNNATFTVTATGTPTYQWQVSTDGGTTFTNIAGATSASYTANGVTAAMNNNQYHVIVSNACPSSATSNNVTLTVQSPPAITAQPAAVTTCVGSPATFSVTATGTNLSYQWQSAASCAGVFTNIAGATSSTYIIAAPTVAMSGTAYHVVITGVCVPASVTSNCVVLTVNTPVSITTQPVSVTTCAGSNATFTVVAAGTAPTYQWQVSTDGGATFTNIAGATAASYTVNGVTTAMNNNQYHVIVSNTCPSSATSNNVTLTVQSPPTITTQPVDVTTCVGNPATFSVTATGTNLSYQWQSAASCAGVFTNIAGATSATYIIATPTAAMSGTAYHVVITGVCVPASVTSNCVVLTVNTPVSVTTQPVNVTTCAGTNASFTVVAAGTAPTYQWQVSTDGGATFTNIASATSASYTITGVTVAMNNNQYHVVVNNACPSSATSANVTLTVQTAPAITTQPTSVTTCSGAGVTFTSAATGTNLTYQWQSAASCAGVFTNIAGATSATYTIASPTVAQNGTAYHVVVSGTCTPAATSNCAVLTVNATTVISAQPADATACAGSSVTFSTTAVGGTITYQWQVSTDGGNTYNNIAGATGAALIINPVTLAMNNNKYRAVINSSCASGVTTNAATLTVQSTPAIITQPVSINTCATSATFSVTATGTGIQYQWQVSTDGGTTYTNIAGANSATVVINNLTAAQANFLYHVVVSTTNCGTVTSNAVTARVGVLPVVVLTAAPTTAYDPAHNGGLFTTVSPAGNYTYQWKRDGVVLATTAPQITAANGLLYDFGTYVVTVTNPVTGCFGVSNAVTIIERPGHHGHLFISPNPTNGPIRVSFYSETVNVQNRMISVYDSKGGRLMTENFTISGRYGFMDLDLTGKPAGTYEIILRDETGKKIAEGSVVKF